MQKGLLGMEVSPPAQCGHAPGWATPPAPAGPPGPSAGGSDNGADADAGSRCGPGVIPLLSRCDPGAVPVLSRCDPGADPGTVLVLTPVVCVPVLFAVRSQRGSRATLVPCQCNPGAVPVLTSE